MHLNSWQRVLRMLRWRRVQHEWTVWMRSQQVADLPLLDAPVPVDLDDPLLPSLPDVPQPMCAAAVMVAAVASGALPALLCEIVKCAAAMSAADPGAADEAQAAPCLRQHRRGARGGRRASSRRLADGVSSDGGWQRQRRRGARGGRRAPSRRVVVGR